MLQRIAAWIVSSCLFGACGAMCQSARPVDGVVPETQLGRTSSGDFARPAWSSLPDAPSAEVARQSEAVGVNFLGETALEPVAPAPSFAMVYETSRAQQAPTDFFSKYLNPSLSKQGFRYRASSKDSLMGRATDAASSIFVTRDESGRRQLNTSYFLRVLTTVAVHRAERPYWARSNTAPLGDFGSTVGNDAGMNVLHEFGPELRQAVTGHIPGFVLKIEQRILQDLNQRQAR